MTDQEKISNERKKIFSESKFQSNNQKYGLFSYTGTLAISDHPYFSQTQPHRDSDGNVITKPHNFLISPPKKGKSPDVYFSLPEYKSDKYFEPKKYIDEKIRSESIKKFHPLPWKPAGPKVESISMFPHLPTEEKKPINRKGPDGKVIIEPKNFFTSPSKKGLSNTPGVLFGPGYEYIDDPYDIKKKIAMEELAKHRSKMQSSPFKIMDHGGRTFGDNQKTFGLEKPLKKEEKQKNIKTETANKPFYTVTGSIDCFEKYPEYMSGYSEPPIKTPAIDKPKWKSTVNLRTIPTPSISNSITNLRSEFSILRRN